MTIPKKITALQEIYGSVGNEWIIKNSLVLKIAQQSGVALGGSIAMAITRKKAIKIPGDLDLFTDDQSKAEDFVNRITRFLNNRKNTYYNMRINNETAHCLEGVKRHYRIVVPFWLPICVMVLDKPIRQFFWHRQPVQYFDDVVEAAKKTTAIDGRERVEYYIPKIKNKMDLDVVDDLSAESVAADLLDEPSMTWLAKHMNGCIS
jgi:hypothetical protein